MMDRGKRSWIGVWRALALTLAVVMAGVGSLLASPQTGAASGPFWHPGGQSWYVDCSAAANGDGSLARPFNSLLAANAVTLGPGQQLLFRRGTACSGMLAPQGSGAPGNPVLIGSYGSPLYPLPRIDGMGTVQRGGVALR